MELVETLDRKSLDLSNKAAAELLKQLVEAYPEYDEVASLTKLAGIEVDLEHKGRRPRWEAMLEAAVTMGRWRELMEVVLADEIKKAFHKDFNKLLGENWRVRKEEVGMNDARSPDPALDTPISILTSEERVRAVAELEKQLVRRESDRKSGIDDGQVHQDIDKLAADIQQSLKTEAGVVLAGARLIKLVGSGNFGSIWSAKDVASGEQRAVKVFHLENLSAGLMLWRFRRSILAMNRLNTQRDCPVHIVKVYGQSEDQLAYAMDFLSGGSLEHIAGKNWTLQDKVDCFLDIVRAVQFAHENAIIHRDIKPANVLLDSHGRAVLTDFDAADTDVLTRTSQNTDLSTLFFVAPEQLADSNSATVQSDVYSLGRLLQFMLLERPIGLRIEDDPALVELDEFPLDLVAVVRKAVQPNPQHRYHNVQLMLDALKEFQNSSVALQTKPRQHWWWMRRIRLAIGAFLAIVVGLVAVISLQRHTAKRLETNYKELRELNRQYQNEHARQVGLSDQLSLLKHERKSLFDQHQLMKNDAKRQLLEQKIVFIDAQEKTLLEEQTGLNKWIYNTQQKVEEKQQAAAKIKTNFPANTTNYLETYGTHWSQALVPLHIEYEKAAAVKKHLSELRSNDTMNLVNSDPNSAQVVDISLLGDLEILTRLDLSSTQVADISLLSKLPNLTELDLSSTQVADISVLETLINIKGLYLNSTPVKQISALGTLPDLKWLDLSSTQVTDISVLDNLKNLTTLDLSSTLVTDISVLKATTELTTLYLRGTSVADISVLDKLPNLTTLHLSSAQVNDLSVLGKLPNLKWLSLSSTPVADISVLATLKNLKSLDLRNTLVSKISTLKNFNELATLDLSLTQVADISALGELTNLTTLSLSSTRVANISVLDRLTNLTWLDLSSTQVADFSMLDKLTNLSYLSLSTTQVADVSALHNLTKLMYLDLSNTPVVNILGLDKLTNLTCLNLSSTQVENISGLDKLTNLTWLDLSSTQVPEEAVVALKASRPGLSVVR